jgi:hypothetical protein
VRWNHTVATVHCYDRPHTCNSYKYILRLSYVGSFDSDGETCLLSFSLVISFVSLFHSTLCFTQLPQAFSALLLFLSFFFPFSILKCFSQPFFRSFSPQYLLLPSLTSLLVHTAVPSILFASLTAVSFFITYRRCTIYWASSLSRQGIWTKSYVSHSMKKMRYYLSLALHFYSMAISVNFPWMWSDDLGWNVCIIMYLYLCTCMLVLCSNLYYYYYYLFLFAIF